MVSPLFDSILNAHKQEIHPDFTREQVAVGDQGRMRDRGLRFLLNSHTDFAPVFIKSRPGELSPYDGLIRTNVGYFRAVRDVEQNIKLLLYAPSADALTMKVQENGHRTLPDTGNYFVVTAREDEVSGQVLRKDMMDFIEYLREQMLFDLNFWMERIPLPENKNGEDTNGKRAYRIANRRMAIGLKPTSDGRWQMMIRPNLMDDNDKLDQFTGLPENMPRGIRLAAYRETQEFDSFGEALTEAKKVAHDTANRIWRGQPLLDLDPNVPALQKLRRNLTRKTLQAVERSAHFARSGKLTPWWIALGVGSVTNAITGDLTSAFTFAAIGAVLGSKVVEEVAGVLLKGNSADRAAQINSARPASYREYKSHYADDTRENLARVCQKPKVAMRHRFYPLTTEEADINYDDGQSLNAYPFEKDWQGSLLLTQLFRTRGSVLYPLSNDMMIAHYPNGLLEFRRILKDDGKRERQGELFEEAEYRTSSSHGLTEGFYTYSPDLELTDRIPLSPDLQDKFTSGQVQKVLYRKGHPLEIQYLDGEDAVAILEEELAGRSSMSQNLCNIFRRCTSKERADINIALEEGLIPLEDTPPAAADEDAEPDMSAPTERQGETRTRAP